MSSRTDLTKMGKHIFDLRKGLGYTQKQLGEMLDVSDKTVSKWEQGDIAPDITILTSLASALKVSVNEILYGEKEEKENEDEKSINLLNLYTEQTKISLTKKIVLFIFTILVVAIFTIYVEDYFKWKVTRLNIEDEFSISGFMVNNSEESKIVLNNITHFNNSEEKIMVSSIEIRMLYKRNEIYRKTSILDNPQSITKVFNNLVIVFETKTSLSKENLSIIIDCVDTDNLNHIYKYDF